MDANDSSKQGPEPEIGTENQSGSESEVTDGGNTSINVPGINIGTDVISPGEGGSNDKIDGSTILPSNPPLTGKLLMYQKYVESKQKQEEDKKKQKRKRNKRKKDKKQQKNNLEKLLPTAKNRTRKLSPRVDSQCLYHDVFTTYLCHFPQNNLSLPKDIIQHIITTSTLPPKRCTKTSIEKYNLEVASWTTTHKTTTAGSSLFFENNVGEDRLPPS
jgi:hypothetical protein